jgi:hypothetical protein
MPGGFVLWASTRLSESTIEENPVKYDDASWHYGGDFPKELPEEAGATHIGMFLAWMLLNGLASDELAEDSAEEIAALRSRSLTGAQFLMRVLDEKLTDDDFSEEGNAFAIAYYQGEDDDSRYLDDYFEIFGVDVASLYEVPDTWENYDRLSARMNERFSAWNADGRPEYVKPDVTGQKAVNPDAR